MAKKVYSGINFETLCSGKDQYYSFNLADLGSEKTLGDIELKLVKQLEDTVKALENGSGRRITHIYIGKTYIRENKKIQILDPVDPKTWISHGIGQSWGFHKHKEHGRDGLVVLGVFTEETVPERCRDRVHQEDFTVAVQQKLLHHYFISHPDPRVVNDSFNSGHTLQRCQEAYALYITFSYDDGYDSKSDSSFEYDEESCSQEDSSDYSSYPSTSFSETGDLSPSGIIEQDSDPEPVIKQGSDPEQIIEQDSDPELVIEQDSDPEPVIEQDSGPEPVIEQDSDPEPVIEQDSDLEPIREQDSDPESIIELDSDPDPVIEQDSDPVPTQTLSPSLETFLATPSSLDATKKTHSGQQKRQQAATGCYLQTTPSRPLTSSSLVLNESKSSQTPNDPSRIQQENIPLQACPSSSKRKMKFDETHAPKKRKLLVIDLTNDPDQL